ncbi:TIGR02391 family protein [Rhodococcus ruber]|uniref:TIGR02391 family protein n=1 Tax=Rhodococcus ruber TaxID=1830 RepID=UPI001F3A981C|nr:TIGR02391 family protein [Rhodococcus ruber]MCF8781240.1 TIGR02391 family protein [Rhodococcus ruber]
MNLDGIDVPWVCKTLDEFVQEVRPIKPPSPSGVALATPQRHAACGRVKAIELAEVARQVLDRLYPEWQAENGPSKYFEFKSERDSAMRLLARLRSFEEVRRHLGSVDPSPRLVAGAMHPIVWGAAKTQWSTGHRHEALLAAAKAVNSYLQTRLNRRDVSEQDLVKQAFSEKDPEPGKPRLRFDDIEDEQTKKSMQNGALQFGAGCFAGIRNPVGHLPNEQVDLSEQEALEQLAALSVFARWVDRTEILRDPSESEV